MVIFLKIKRISCFEYIINKYIMFFLYLFKQISNKKLIQIFFYIKFYFINNFIANILSKTNIIYLKNIINLE